VGDEVEKSIDHVLRLALVQPDLLEQHLCQLRLGQRRWLQAFGGQFEFIHLPCLSHAPSHDQGRRAYTARASDATTARTAASISSSVSVASSRPRVRRIARLFSSAARPPATPPSACLRGRYTSNSTACRNSAEPDALMTSITARCVTACLTTTAMSRSTGRWRLTGLDNRPSA